MIEMLVVLAMPAGMADELDALMERVGDETVCPEGFLDEMDDFMRRLCKRTGADYEEIYGAGYKERYAEWLAGDRESEPPSPAIA